MHLQLRNCLSSSQGCRYSAPNPTLPLFSFWGPLLALGGRDGGSSGKVGGGSQAPGLCFLSGGEGCYTVIVGALLYCLCPKVSAPSLDLAILYADFLRQYCWGHRKYSCSLNAPLSWDLNELQAVSRSPHLCTSPFAPLLFTLICPPSDVSMHGSLSCVCVLHREPFVEL